MLRLKGFYEHSDNLSLELAFEATPVSRHGEFPDVINGAAYRAFDTGSAMLNNTNSDFHIQQNLDRLFITLRTSRADIMIGRQPVSFGSARAINPTDVIAPYAYNTIAKEEIPGVDSLRLRAPLGLMGELDAGAVFGKNLKPERSAAFLRIKTYASKTDLTGLLMLFRENLLLGTDISGSVGGAALWVEAAYVFSGLTDGYQPKESYTRATAGAEYMFTGKLIGRIEYIFNGAGAFDDYDNPSSETAYDTGGVFLQGRHYMAPALTYELYSLLGVSASALYNLRDGSVLLSPSLTLSLSDESTLRAGMFAGTGPAGSSEFGSYDDVYYIGVSLYF